MKTKIPTQITVVPPPLSLLVFYNGGGVRRTEGVESTDGMIDKLIYELSHSLRFGDNIWAERGRDWDCGRVRATPIPSFAKHPVGPPFEDHKWGKGN